MSEKIKCPICKGLYLKKHKLDHLQSNRHLNVTQNFITDENVDTIIHDIQKNYDKNTYVSKHKHDKLKCLLCKGSYSRQKKSSHYSTPRHCNAVEKLKEQLIKIFN